MFLTIFKAKRWLRIWPLKAAKDVYLISDKMSCGDNVIANVDHIIGPENDNENNPVGFWPWMASFGYFNKTNNSYQEWSHQCGATLISQEHFLTAGHCAAQQER